MPGVANPVEESESGFGFSVLYLIIVRRGWRRSHAAPAGFNLSVIQTDGQVRSIEIYPHDRPLFMISWWLAVILADAFPASRHGVEQTI